MQAWDTLAAVQPAQFERDNRYLWAAVVGLLVVHVTLAWLTRPGGIETGHDDAQYILLGGSLARGEYRDVFQVDAPLHRMYPPGYPALLAVWEGVAGERFDALVTLSIVSSTVALALTFATLRRLFSSSIAVLCLAVLAVNPYLLDYAGRVVSEAPYSMFSLVALWALTRTEASPRMGFLAGASAIAAALTRSIGVTLLIALGIHWILERRFARAAALATAAAVTVGLWTWWTAMAPVSYVGRSYLADATFSASGHIPRPLAWELAHRVVHNVPAYLGLTLPQLMSFPTVPGTVVDNVLAAAITTGGLAAGMWVFARSWRPAALYLLAYGALLAAWPWQIGRFAVPVLVVAVPAVLIGSGWLTSGFGARWGPRTTLTLGSILALNGAVHTAEMVRVRGQCVRGRMPPSPTCVG